MEVVGVAMGGGGDSNGEVGGGCNGRWVLVAWVCIVEWVRCGWGVKRGFGMSADWRWVKQGFGVLRMI